jgi:hypothetical protein
MDSKHLKGVQIKDASKGTVSAVFSTFNVIDSDNDVTLPDAFTDGAEVAISAYGHTSWGGALPAGKGVIRTTKSEAILEGQFFLDTTHGADTFKVVKAMGARQQWSYGFDIVDGAPGTFDGKDVQFLRKLDVHEVSPVLVGAGVNTRTLAAKGRKAPGGSPLMVPAGRLEDVSEWHAAIRPHETPTTRKAWDGDAAERALGDLPTLPDLRAAHAWCDPHGDPESKTSYRFLHHEGGGAANLRACLMGIGRILGGKSGLSDTDSRMVYNHLAGHLEDADIEPPEMRSGSDGISKQNGRLAVLLADMASTVDEIATTRITRAAKGRTLGSATVLFLEWIGDTQRELKAVLDSPQEEMTREWLRLVNSLRSDQEN